MTEKSLQFNVQPESEKADTAVSASGKVFASGKVKTLSHKRTLGEKTVDNLIYSFVNNFLVIGTSVVATYLTKRGDTVGTEGGFIRKVGNALKRRGDWTQEKFQTHLGMNEKSADMAKMVFFSFADGTILTPFVKILEDKREKIARWVDKSFGSKNVDDLVYKTEPKQTWYSVISGRIASLSIVLPTAIALDRFGKKESGEWGWRNNNAGKSLNDFVFDKPSEKLASQLEEKTSIKRRFPKLDTAFLSKTLLFEAVYTSICTTGLYFISRAFVKHSKKHQERVKEYILHTKKTIPEQNEKNESSTPTDTPGTNVLNVSHTARISEASQPLISA